MASQSERRPEAVKRRIPPQRFSANFSWRRCSAVYATVCGMNPREKARNKGTEGFLSRRRNVRARRFDLRDASRPVAPDSAFGMTVWEAGTAMHDEWPCHTGPKRGCRAEVPGATFKAKTHPKRQKQIPRRYAPRDDTNYTAKSPRARDGKARGALGTRARSARARARRGNGCRLEPGEKHVAAPWATRAAAASCDGRRIGVHAPKACADPTLGTTPP
jgi:hypothetical protein